MVACSMCNFRGMSSSALVHHILRLHPNFFVHCRHEGCEQTFRKWKSFTQHLRRRHGELHLSHHSDAVLGAEETVQDTIMDRAEDPDSEDTTLVGGPAAKRVRCETGYPGDPSDHD